mgnify:CR=1 FL=1
MAARFPQVQVHPDAIFTEDEGIWTGAGVSAGIDMALAMGPDRLQVRGDLRVRATTVRLEVLDDPLVQVGHLVPATGRVRAAGPAVEAHPSILLLLVAGFGLLSAVLAAVIPALSASRQDVVAVLAGRRGEPRASGRTPIVGIVLLGVGILGATLGSLQKGSPAVLIAGAAVISVIGMILVVPMVVTVVARLAARLPMSLRFAARDAARHRTRTVPAIAAVGATVAGVVALGIAVSSQEAANEQAYQQQLPLGRAAITAGDADPDDVLSVVRTRLPQATIVPVVGADVFGQPLDDDPGPGQPLVDEVPRRRAADQRGVAEQDQEGGEGQDGLPQRAGQGDQGHHGHQDPAAGLQDPRHHGRSAARGGAVRSAQAEGCGDHRRNLRHDRIRRRGYHRPTPARHRRGRARHPCPR